MVKSNICLESYFDGDFFSAKDGNGKPTGLHGSMPQSRGLAVYSLTPQVYLVVKQLTKAY